MSQTTTPTRHPALASSLSVDNTAEVYDTEVDYNHKPPVMGIISHPVSRNLSRVSADTNIPTEGDDTLFGTEENDTISGLAGNDVINGLSGKDKLDGGAGSDIINGGAGNDLLDGGVLDDYSQGAIDTLIGNTGNDTFLSRGFFGAGNYSGGDGTDRLDFSQPDAYTSERRSTDGAGVKVNLAVGSASTYYLQASDFTWLDPNGQISLAAIENVRGTGQGDILIGDDNANELDGGAGSDVINGGSGDDSLDGGVLDNYSPGVIDTLNGDSGNDTFLSRGFYGQGNYSGGEGVDWLDFSQSDAFTTTRRNIEGLGVKVDLTAGTAFTRYQQALDSTWPDPNGQIVVATIENIRGTVQGDILIGDSNANELDGGAGNDVLKGGEGADTLTGGIGDDSYEVDSADDVVTEAANAGTDTVQSGISYSLSDNLENLTLIGTSAGNGTGTAFDNIIIGNSAANTLNGGDGNDTLDGGALDDYSPGVVNELNGDNGDDTFLSRGFFGADSYAGGDGVDGIDFSKPDAYTAGRRSAEGAGVKVDLAVGTVFNYYRAAVNYTWTDPNGQIVLAAIENVRGTEQGDIINGDGNANLLDGGAGSDVINGGSGDDTLDGGALDDYFPGIIDTLKGNTGNDTFLSRGFFGAGNYGGGDGIDWLDFSQSDAYSTARRSSDGAGVKVDLAAGNASTYYLQASGFTWLDPNGQIRLATIENVRGTGQGDIISGDSNANQLDGGAGNDVLNGGAGADTLIGGAGDDTYVVDAVDDIVTEAANAGNDTIQAGFSYYSLGDNFENLTLIGAAAISGTGNDLDNILIGNSATNMLNGGAGNDTLDGGALDEYIPGIIDSLNGNSGNDTLLSRGFFGASNYAGGDGADWLDFSRPDVYTAARRNADDAGVKVDLAAANASTYYLQASDFTWLDPNGQIRLATIENVRGTGQDDNISGDGNANELDGGAGSDVLNGGSGDDSLDGGALDEYIPGVINTLNGNSGNDSFLSRGFFGAGNYAGGDGIDRLDFSRPDAYTATRRSSDGAGVKVDLAAGNASAYYLQASDFTWLDANGQISLAAIENVLGTEQGDLLIGDGNANEFDGGAGNDVLNGGAGADTLIGGAGDDTYVVDAAFDRVYETESAGNDTVQTSFTYSLGGNLENLTLIGTIAVSGVGNALDNTITGNSAANTLSGGGGNDTLDGGALDDYSPGVIDKLNGNTGDDTFLARGFFGAGNYAGGDGSDWIDFSHPDAYTDERRNADGAGIKVNLSVGAVSTYYLQASGFIWLDPNGQISVTGVENVRGTEQGDIIIGDSNANEFDGGSGNDVLNGGLGADTLIGGGGDDIYTVDAVDDIVTEAANAGIDTVQAGISYSLGDNLENLTLTGITAISGIGNDFDNILIGNSAVNTLNGGAGNDTLDGGVLDEYSPGVIDILNGDAGNDSLLFRGFFGSGNFDGGEGSDRLDFSRSDSYTATRRSAEGAGVKVDLVAGSAFSYYRSADGYTQINSDGPIVFTSIENVIGTAQGDILIGDDNANELDGGAGSDVVNGGSGDDTLAGGALDEYAPGVTDTVNGDAGNDTLLSRGFFGADNYDGGDGVDWLDFSRPDAYTSERRSTDGAGAKVDLVAGSASTYYLQASGFTWLDVNGQIALTSIENVRGTEQSDNINGDDNANKLDGGAGSDVVNGGAGDDTLSGGALDEYTPVTDTLNGGDGNDAFLSQGFFGAGDYAGGDGADWLDFSQPDAYTSERRNSDGAGAKVDLAAGSASTYYLQASGFTWLDPNGQIGLTTIENVRGTGQGDIIIGDSNANEFDGGAGSDVLNGGSGNDILDGGVLDDYTPGVTDRLNGDAGNDTFLSRGFFGAGDYSGGEGADWLDFSRPDAYTSERRSTDGAGIKVDLAAGSAYTYYSQASGFTWLDPNGQISLAAIENVLGTAQGDILIGDSHANVFDAGAGSDVLNGGSGDDILDGGVLDDYSPGVIDTLNGDSGNDTFLSRGFYGQGNYSGGEGVDWLDFSRPDAFTATHRNAEGLGIKVDLAVGTAFTRYQQALDFTWPDPNGQIAVASIENIRGTEQSDILIGDGNANQLDGGAGNDVLKGGEGADALIGGIGDDSYEVDSASDVVTETANAGSDTVLSGISYSLGDNLENLTLIGTSAGNGTGNAFGNIIIGNSAANILNGGDGNDTLDAGALDDYSPGVVNELNGNNGDDTFLCRGFFGADSYAGGDGADWLDFSQPDAYTAGRRSGEGGGVKVDLVAGKAFTYYVGAKDFTWNDPNGQIALASIENIRGTAQDDILSGDNNANVFDGGAGNDLLMGGLGADTFQLRSLGNIDTLQNYSIDDDTIQLDNAAFTAFTHTGTLAASSLRVSVAVKALDADDFLIYSSTTGKLYYDADGNGTAHPAVEIAVLGANLALTNADFVVI